MQTLVVIPAYNEAAEILQRTVSNVLAAGYRVVVVDDGSEKKVLDDFFHERLHLLRHAVNLGQGAALQTAFNYALRKRIDIVVTFDADGQHDVQDIAPVISPIQSGAADVVLGSRFISSSSGTTIPWQRLILLRVGVLFNTITCGLWLTDAHNGLRALHHKALSKITLQENRMAHATELIRKIKQHRLRWEEVPVNITYSAYSLQKDNALKRAFHIVRDIFLRLLMPDEGRLSRFGIVLTLLLFSGFFFLFSGILSFWLIIIIAAGVSGFLLWGYINYRRQRENLLQTTASIRAAALAS